ncbi:uncharacterized protein LOC129901214 [Solanum dulcamara]|uniref:uncharacterized protein LOC129901214 n=1 Tax=Solanum dulcamara TaxID=45834 RepID=UPI002484DEFE|nr:uncharacterized protein LOC129901214 [Solanum dulcamara]
MGLNEIYIVIRGSILMINPLPFMAQAFSLLVQDEHQREMTIGAGKPQAYKTNYSLNSNSQSHYKDRFCDCCKSSSHLRENCYLLHVYPNNNNQAGQRNNNMHNTTQRPNTFRPAPLRYNQNNGQNNNAPRYNRGNGNRTVTNVHCTQDLATSRSTEKHEEVFNVSLTKDQYSHVQEMLQHFQMELKDQPPVHILLIAQLTLQAPSMKSLR